MTPPSATVRDSEVCTAELPGLAVERETGPAAPETLHSAITEGDRSARTTAEWMARFGAYCTPPALLTERRPAVDTMREYVDRGRYAETLKHPRRRLARVWLAVVAIPAVAVARLFEWLLERPARFAVTVVTVKLLSTLPPVGWLADHVITPGVNAALWLFL